MKEAKYVHNAREYYNGGLGVGRFINRRLTQSNAPGYGNPPNLPIGYPAPCCGTNERAADQAQTKN